MATQNTTGFQVGANINPFEQAMQRMVGQARTTSTSINKALGVIGVSLSVAAFSVWIRGAIDAADETSKLAQKTGLAVNQVAGLKLAFEQAGAGDVFATSIAKLSKSVVDGSKSFDAMGINVRNADGTLKTSRQVIGEVADKFASYKDGIEKTALAQEIFGKSGADLIPLLNSGAAALDEYDAMAAKLGLTIEESTAQQAEKFNDTLDLVSQGTKGLSTQIAAQLLPTLSGLADQFFTSMSSGDKLKNTATILSTAMKGLYITGLAVVETFTTVGTVLGGVSAAIFAAVSGNFSGAMNIIDGLKTDVARGWKTTLSEIDAAWNATGSNAVENTAKLRNAGKNAAPETPSAKKEKTEKKEESAVPAYEAALAARKIVYEKENTLREFSKQQELDYWKGVLADDEISSKDRTKILIKTGKLELEILRQNAKDKAQIQQLHAEDYKAETLDYVNELEARAAFERDMGTTTQADYLARQAGFNQLRLQAELDFIQQKITAAQADPDANVVALEQLEMQKLEIKRKYRALEMDLNRQQALESTTELRGMFGSIQSGWSASIKGMLNGTKTLGQGLQGMFQAVSDAVVSMLAEMAAKWLIQQALMMVFGKTMAMSTIAEKSAEAGAGGVASMAAAPWPLNMSAPAFGAAMAAAAASFGVVASAAGGYDIPAGLNPLTQLHEQEMVLPAEHANVIRKMADDGQGGGGGGGGNGVGTVIYNIKTPDANSFRRSQRQIERASFDAFNRSK